ncbi:MAG TPA: hypothetical protein VER17_01550 [Tepidisphaeraceae bacterium]|nr:hypothetical protein [Tepidisphaeraceae bacterium]
MAEPSAYACPRCQQPVVIPAATPGAGADEDDATAAAGGGGEYFTCPSCGGEFTVPREHGDVHDGGQERAHELDGTRIRLLAAGRRAAYRARSYCVIAAAACAVAVVQLLWMTLRHVRDVGWTRQPFGYLLLAALAVAGGAYFARRAAALHREARRTLLAAAPEQPPNFDGLDDGSGRWKNLEDVR